MTEIKDATRGDNEEKLKNENADLRKRIKKLQKENASLREKLSLSEEKPLTTKVEKKSPVIKEEKKSLKLFKKQKKEELPESKKKPAKSVVSKETNLEIPPEFASPSVPLSSKYKTIMDGDSRRMCPSCDNSHHNSIYEEIDKTHIIMDYPRIYGKKYKCGLCGQEWRVPVSLE